MYAYIDASSIVNILQNREVIINEVIINIGRCNNFIENFTNIITQLKHDL